MLRTLPLLVMAILLSGAAPERTIVLPNPADQSGAGLAKACEGRDGWDDPVGPARLFGNTWYVGTCGITALLVTSPQGHVLIDTGPANTWRFIINNIERAGFRPGDVRWIVGSHEHHDHVGGVAAIARETRAKVAALPAQAAALRRGQVEPADPQAAIHPAMAPARVHVELVDGRELRVGPLRLRPVSTPTHSAGSTSWSWQSCEGRDCRTFTYADSATAVSADNYRFVDHPDRIAMVRRGLDRIAALPCGMLVTPHPSASGLFERLATGSLAVDRGACRAYAKSARERFDARLAKERATP